MLLVPDTFDEAYGDEEPGVYDGMVHSQGPVVLSVRAVEAGWARRDGNNVVLHELAHVFDFEGWEADGAPSFLDPRSADAWRDLVRREMRRAERGDGVLRSYAATAPAELFAVATEQFFERPARLRNRHPELFDALVAFYNATPARRGPLRRRRELHEPAVGVRALAGARGKGEGGKGGKGRKRAARSQNGRGGVENSGTTRHPARWRRPGGVANLPLAPCPLPLAPCPLPPTPRARRG